MATTLSGFTIATPGSAPTAAVGTATGALGAAQVYQYKATFVTAFGETDGFATASSVTTTSTGSVNLTAIPVSTDKNVIHRNLYRTTGGGTSFLLLATLNDNTTTTYTDLIADASLGAAIPTLNTAHSLQIINGVVQLSRPLVHSVESGITAHAGGGQTSAYALSAEYSIVATVATTGDSVILPPLNSSHIGKHMLICNDGANSLNVYPAVGQDASGGTNVAVAVTATSRAEFIGKSATAWEKTR